MVGGAAREAEVGRTVRMNKVMKKDFSEAEELTWGFEGWVRVGQIGRVGRAFQEGRNSVGKP